MQHPQAVSRITGQCRINHTKQVVAGIVEDGVGHCFDIDVLVIHQQLQLFYFLHCSQQIAFHAICQQLHGILIDCHAGRSNPLLQPAW